MIKPFTLVILGMVLGFHSIGNAGQINRDQAIDYLKQKGVSYSKKKIDRYLVLSEVEDHYTLACILRQNYYRYCHVIRIEDGVVVSYFDSLAKNLIERKIIIVFHKAQMQEFPLELDLFMSRSAFAMSITDVETLGEVLRNIHGYSAKLLPSVDLVESDKKEAQAKYWEKAYLIGGHSPAAVLEVPELKYRNGVKVRLRGFSQRSVEVKDGNIASLIRNPKKISDTPFTKPNGVVNFQPWSLTLSLVTALGEDGLREVIATRNTTRLDIERGSDFRW